MSNPDPTDDHLSDTPADAELAAALSGLRPRAARLDATAALFEAGRRAGVAAERQAARRSLVAWRAAAAVLVVVTGVSVMSHLRPPAQTPIASVPSATTTIVPPTIERPTTAGISTPPARTDGVESPVLAGTDLLTLRTIALSQGVDALPKQSFGSAGSPLSVGSFRQ